MFSRAPSIKRRKSLHLKFARDEGSQVGNTGLDQVKLPYRALPERSLEEIDL